MLLPMLLGLLGLGIGRIVGVGNQSSAGTPAVPSIADPNVWPAGASASRRAGNSSGVPQGMQWQSAANFVTAMPKLIGR